MVRSFNGYTPTAINDYQKLKHELKTVKFNMGFAYEGTIGGYIEIDIVQIQQLTNLMCKDTVPRKLSN